MLDNLREISEATEIVIPIITASALILGAIGFLLASFRKFAHHKEFEIPFDKIHVSPNDFVDILVMTFFSIICGFVLPFFIRIHVDDVFSATFLMATFVLIGYIATFMKFFINMKLQRKSFKTIGDKKGARRSLFKSIGVLCLFPFIFAAFMIFPISSSVPLLISFLAAFLLLIYFATVIINIFLGGLFKKIFGIADHYAIVNIEDKHYWVLIRHSPQQWICIDYKPAEKDSTIFVPIKGHFVIKSLEGAMVEVLEKDDALKRKLSESTTSNKVT